MSSSQSIGKPRRLGGTGPCEMRSQVAARPWRRWLGLQAEVGRGDGRGGSGTAQRRFGGGGSRRRSRGGGRAGPRRSGGGKTGEGEATARAARSGRVGGLKARQGRLRAVARRGNRRFRAAVAQGVVAGAARGRRPQPTRRRRGERRRGMQWLGKGGEAAAIAAQGQRQRLAAALVRAGYSSHESAQGTAAETTRGEGGDAKVQKTAQGTPAGVERGSSSPRRRFKMKPRWRGNLWRWRRAARSRRGTAVEVTCDSGSRMRAGMNNGGGAWMRA